MGANEERMIEEQIVARGVRDPRVLEAMRNVPRAEFVPPDVRGFAYSDRPVPLGEGQTVSQPYIVAFMTELLRCKPTDRALDVGTGSGYQAAILAELCAHVTCIELSPTLAAAAQKRLARYPHVEVHTGDGAKGHLPNAPYDVILAAAASHEIPPALLDELAPSGRLVMPVGRSDLQHLVVARKNMHGHIDTESIAPVRFVPLR